MKPPETSLKLLSRFTLLRGVFEYLSRQVETTENEGTSENLRQRKAHQRAWQRKS